MTEAATGQLLIGRQWLDQKAEHQPARNRQASFMGRFAGPAARYMRQARPADYPDDFIRRFSNNVKPGFGNGCSLWTGNRDKDGYGKSSLRGKTLKAHRVSYEIEYGAIDGDLCVLHRCDTPACVRPDHLFLGTQAENNLDKLRKGRQPRGETHWLRRHPDQPPNAKLNAQAVREIRQRHGAGENLLEIGARFAVSRQTIARVISGRTWGHIR